MHLLGVYLFPSYFLFLNSFFCLVKMYARFFLISVMKLPRYFKKCGRISITKDLYSHAQSYSRILGPYVLPKL